MGESLVTHESARLAHLRHEGDGTLDGSDFRLRFATARNHDLDSNEVAQGVSDASEHIDFGCPERQTLAVLGGRRIRERLGDNWIIRPGLVVKRSPREMVDEIEQCTEPSLAPQFGYVNPTECKVSLNLIAVAID